MTEKLLILIGILVAIILILLAKIYSLKKAAGELAEVFSGWLSADTNTLIGVSCRDKHIRKLATAMNEELKVLRKEQQRFYRGDAEVKEAVTNISHDLRTPLTAICGYLDLLEKEEKSEAVGRYIERIKNRTEALKQLTEELFRYSVVASVEELKPEKTNMCRVLEECILSFYGTLQLNGITPDIQIPCQPVYRNLDVAALSRIFSNIISNAIKYSDGDFSVRLDEDGTILFSNSAKELTAVTAGRLFDRFYTVEAGRNSTGLGLSIAKLLTERMGGSIEAEYKDGRLYIKIKFLPL